MQHPSGDPPLPLDDIADATRLLIGQSDAHHEPELPEAYGRSGLILMVKDPHSLFAYWEWSPTGENGSSSSYPALWLRLYETDVAGRELHPLPSRHRVTAVGRYHLHVPHGARHYLARLESDCGETLLTSNVVATPPDRPSDQWEAAWSTHGAFSHWFELVPHGPSSPGLNAGIQSRWLAPGLGGSPMPQGQQARLLQHLDVRLIVSGQTLPGVTVTAMGTPVQVEPDGTFTFEANLQEETLTLAMRLEENKGQWETSVLSLERRPRTDGSQ